MPQLALHVILNPKSGGGQAGRQRDEIVRELEARGASVELHLTEAPRHGARLAYDMARSGAAIVVAAGGDGTIHDVANGILTAGTETALGIIPLGTGNDFAKVVPGASARPGAYDVLIHARTEPFDVAYATWAGGSEYFVNAMGSGIDVEVVRQLNNVPALPGPVKYLLALCRALVVYRPIALTARADHETIARRIMMMALGNGVCQGGGFYLTPHARPADGKLELCVIDALAPWKIPPVLIRVLRGTHMGHGSVTMRSVERVRFESDGQPLYFQLDGELREPVGAHWLEVELRPHALRVVVAQRTDR